MSEIVKIKPCNVGWEQMSPEEKGRHCHLCSKTVVDFTQMNKAEIHAELKRYFKKGQIVCGHFAAEDVDEVVVEIPVQLLSQKMNFSKRFALALLVVMGTSIISCTNNKGEKERLKDVIITENVRGIDTISVDSDSLKLIQDSIPKLGEAISEPKEITNETIEVEIDTPKIKGDVVIIHQPEIVGKPALENDSIVKQNCELPEIKDTLLNDSRSFMLGKMVPVANQEES